MIKDIPQFVPQKICLSCDGCCRFKEHNSSWRPKVAQEERNERFQQELDEGGYIKTVERQGQIQCTFLKEDNNTCQVYDRRPFECRLYPFLLIREGNDLSVGVHLSCPYVQETRYSRLFEDYLKNLQQYFQQDDVREFLKRNSMLIGDYPEYKQEIEPLFTLTLSDA